MPRSSTIILVVAGLAALLVGALAELLPLVPIDSTPQPRPNYEDPAAWLCRPGRADPCSTPTTATVFAADGGKTTVTYKPDPAAPIDCFYVYPTVSHAYGTNAPIAVTGDEDGAARRQLARFAPVCRLFAPLYRQVTRSGLREVLDGDPATSARLRQPAYEDVLAAWRTYLAKDNAGRGIVLIGHSQGAMILARLMKAEIDGKPIAAKLVSAIIPGTLVDVPPGKRRGGTFKQIPLCASASETGCVIPYSSYPADRPIPADARFGGTRTPGMRFACVDPAALAGTSTLDADLPLTPALRAKYETDFAELPGLISAACTEDGPLSVLAITVSPHDRAGEKTKAMLDRLAEYSPTWGLHGLDVNLALGTLVDVVREETAAYAHR